MDVVYITSMFVNMAMVALVSTFHNPWSAGQLIHDLRPRLTRPSTKMSASLV